jgi:predicted aspartyl protease
MTKLSLLGIFVVAVAPFAQAEQSGSLVSFLGQQGLAGAKLERRFGNHLFLPVSINTHRAALMIDTGSPATLLDKNSVTTFGLKTQNTTINVAGVFGKRWERYALSMANSIAMGNCVLTNVPVALADESSMNVDVNSTQTGSHIPTVSRLPHINGLLGAREMRKFGMIVDCTRQMLYINPSGANANVSQKLAAFLGERGFTRVPLRLNSSDHFDVAGALNGHATRFIVDTGASTTLIDQKTAVHSDIGVAATSFLTKAGEGRLEPLGTATVKELAIGDFTIPKAEILVVNVSRDVLHSQQAEETNAGLLGAEHLAFNFAVIDVGGMAIYLRHADSR